MHWLQVGQAIILHTVKMVYMSKDFFFLSVCEIFDVKLVEVEVSPGVTNIGTTLTVGLMERSQSLFIKGDWVPWPLNMDADTKLQLWYK